ncbi:MAG: hypothetical protein F6K28_48855 [Microcoleus sp. SIO2G3]|nr:hypothetical protein [Microcoleus sp. SIO2G3]
MNRKTFSALMIAATLILPALPVRADSYDSWIDSDTLAGDPQAYCSDVGLGHNVDASSTSTAQNDIGTFTQNDTNSVSTTDSGYNNSSSDSYSHAEGGGGFSIFGFGASGSGSSTNSSSNTSSNGWDSSYNSASDNGYSSTWDQSSQSHQEELHASLQTGHNCDAFVGAAAARDMNHENNQTAREAIATQERIFDNGLRSRYVENLLRW